MGRWNADPDWDEPDEPTDAEMAEQWHDEWFGMWLSDMNDDAYEASVDASTTAGAP